MKKFLLFAFLICVFVLPVFAQEDAQPIAYGDEVEATQRSNDGDYWVFEGAEGDLIDIQMASENFDTYLELYNEDGDLIAANDDAGDLQHSRIAFMLPADGNYFILARSFGNNSRREDYTLSLSLVDPDQVIAYGDEVEGRVSDDVGEAWLFIGTEGDVVTISMDSDIIDTYLELYDPTGLLIALNDDSGGTLDSQITNFALPSDGLYTIIARSFAGGSSGAYTLTLEGTAGSGDGRSRGGDEVEISGEPQGEIELGEVVEGNIRDANGDLWTFVGTEGDVVLIAMNNPSTDCYLDLFDPDGEYLLRDDDSGIGFNAAIIIELPADGEYTIVTRGFAGQTGPYQMSVSVLEELDQIIYVQVNSSDYVNLRDGANGEVVDSTYPGDFFVLIGRSEDGQWLQIASVVEDPLWVAARVISVLEGIGTTEDIEDLPVTE